MITVKQYIDHLNKMILEDKSIENLPIIYATDEDGSNYHLVYNKPSLASVEDIDEWNLEVMFDDEEPNCVLIN